MVSLSSDPQHAVCTQVVPSSSEMREPGGTVYMAWGKEARGLQVLDDPRQDCEEGWGPPSSAGGGLKGLEPESHGSEPQSLRRRARMVFCLHLGREKPLRGGRWEGFRVGGHVCTRG